MTKKQFVEYLKQFNCFGRYSGNLRIMFIHGANMNKAYSQAPINASSNFKIQVHEIVRSKSGM